MASNIGNHFNNIGSELIARGPSQETLKSVLANTGGQAAHAQASLGKKGTIHVREGVDISTPSQDVFKPHQQHMVEEHGMELAELTGLSQDLHDDEGEIEDRRERNHDRNVGGKESEKARLHQVLSPKGVVQDLPDDDHQRLQELDSQLHTALHLNGDLKPEQLEAARRMLNTQPGKVEKNAEFKYGPEAEQAIRPELAPVPMLAGTMDICGAGSDKLPPLHLEMSSAEMDLAKAFAADQLARGDVGESLVA